ncbi:MAG TPA: hypothetical protein VN783_12350 [Thermoanaerobaculia bacterium]|nr:hypothetical protein [Thermoanaerobaculia bacterium]
MSEYDPIFGGPAKPEALDDLEPVRERFLAASRPYLSSPWTWLAWSLILPAAAWATPVAFRIRGPAGVLFTWSFAILLGGAVEIGAIRRVGRGLPRSGLARWALRAQGNLSLVALLLSGVLIWQDLAWLLPGLWLLLLGHSLFVLGGLSFPPMRTCGLIYQLGALAALGPGSSPLLAFALATFAGNLWMARAIRRELRAR